MVHTLVHFLGITFFFFYFIGNIVVVLSPLCNVRRPQSPWLSFRGHLAMFLWCSYDMAERSPTFCQF